MTAVAAAELVGLGVAIGAFGTLIGAGGGFLLVSLLLLLYHFSHPTAVGTSLALVFLNAASGSVAYLRQRRVDLSLGWKFAAATIPGAIIGAFLTRSISSSVFNLLFGIVLVAIAVLLFSGIAMAPSRRAGVRQVVDCSREAPTYRVDVWKGIVVSLFVGFMSSILGIGGGIIPLAVLIVPLSLPIPIATATSALVVARSAFIGA